MKRLKTPLRSDMSDARLTSPSVIHVQKHKEIDIKEVISEFAGKKDRRNGTERKTLITSYESYPLLC